MLGLSTLTTPLLMSKLAIELEAGGFEKFFRDNGEQALPCAYALEEMDISGAGQEASGQFWEAMAILGSDIAWDDAMSRRWAIAALTEGDRERLQALAQGVLDCLYDMDFLLDG